MNYRTAIRGIGAISLVLTLVSAYFLFQRTAAQTTLSNPATWELLMEMTMLVLLLAAIFRYPLKSRKSLWASGQSSAASGQSSTASGQSSAASGQNSAASGQDHASDILRGALCGAVVLGYLWLHQILVPILAAGVYLGYLILLGAAVSDLLNGRCPAHEQSSDHGRCRPCDTPGNTPGNNPGNNPGTAVWFRRAVPAFHKTARDLLLGASLQLIITAAFAAAQKGGTGFLRIQCLLVFLPVLGWHIYRKTRHADPVAGQHDPAIQKNNSVMLSILPAMLIAGLLLQAGRMNIALDYDSLHYSLRSAFVLDNGAGIFQNLGFVNDVYVYPKGLETLCLPLSGLASGAFVTAVSWWLTAGSLWAVYTIAAGEYSRRRLISEDLSCPGKTPAENQISFAKKKWSITGLCAAVCVCAVPGIMNMAASAKTDAATLFFQLLCIAEFVEAFEAESRISQLPGSAHSRCGIPSGLLAGLAAAVFTLIFKPTSYLFSLLLVLAALVIFLLQRRGRRKMYDAQAEEPVGAQTISAASARPMPAASAQILPAASAQTRAEGCTQFRVQDAAVLIAALAAFLLITLRTVLIAGVPVTTAGGSLWRLFGFELKYPFAGLNAAGDEGQSLIKRLIGVFACPVGEDMAHVYIAWGGLIPVLCILTAAVRAVLFRKKPAEKKAKVDISPAQPGIDATQPGAGTKYLYLSLTLVLIASIGCINTLYQVDGNYFMLLYALAVICAFRGPGDAAKFPAPDDVSANRTPLLQITPEIQPAENTSLQLLRSPFKEIISLQLLKALAPALALGALMCCITNWAGVPGLSQPSLLHKGYVNQIEQNRAAHKAQGTGELYTILESDPTARVLAMSEQPACFVYRCNVQSYTDLEGSGGNVYLVKTLDLFKEYLDYANEDYILTDDAFLSGHTRAADIVGYMLEDGSLTPVWEGAGKHLYRYESGR